MSLHSCFVKPANSHSLAILSSTVRLREVILAVWTSNGYRRPLTRDVRLREVKKEIWKGKCRYSGLVSSYERCPITGGIR